MKFCEVYPCSEGFVATEDPRHGLLRLVPDHDIFFEFVPVEELGRDRPARHTVGTVETGVHVGGDGAMAPAAKARIGLPLV